MSINMSSMPNMSSIDHEGNIHKKYAGVLQKDSTAPQDAFIKTKCEDAISSIDRTIQQYKSLENADAKWVNDGDVVVTDMDSREGFVELHAVLDDGGYGAPEHVATGTLEYDPKTGMPRSFTEHQGWDGISYTSGSAFDSDWGDESRHRSSDISAEFGDNGNLKTLTSSTKWREYQPNKWYDFFHDSRQWIDRSESFQIKINGDGTIAYSLDEASSPKAHR